MSLCVNLCQLVLICVNLCHFVSICVTFFNCVNLCYRGLCTNRAKTQVCIEEKNIFLYNKVGG